MTESKGLVRAQKPDAQGFDEIRIRTEPYFKESGLSGDEWRIRVYTEFYRKGNLVHTNNGHTSMDYAVWLLSHSYIEALDNGYGYFAGESDYCDQEGCSNKATITYECKESGCGRCGNVEAPKWSRPYRKFCERHKRRGDSSLDDMDAHYSAIETPPQPAAQGGGDA